MLGWALDRSATSDLGAGVDQFLRVERPPTIFTLITPCLRVVAVRAGPFYVPIWEEPVSVGVIVLIGRPLVYMAFLKQTEEDVLSDIGVVLGAGGCVTVPTDTETVPVVEELGVVSIDDVRRADAFLIGPHCDWCSMHIGTTDHQHSVADLTLEASEHIRW